MDLFPFKRKDPYEQPIQNYIKAINNFEGDKYLALIIFILGILKKEFIELDILELKTKQSFADINNLLQNFFQLKLFYYANRIFIVKCNFDKQFSIKHICNYRSPIYTRYYTSIIIDQYPVLKYYCENPNEVKIELLLDKIQEGLDKLSEETPNPNMIIETKELEIQPISDIIDQLYITGIVEKELYTQIELILTESIPELLYRTYMGFKRQIKKYKEFMNTLIYTKIYIISILQLIEIYHTTLKLYGNEHKPLRGKEELYKMLYESTYRVFFLVMSNIDNQKLTIKNCFELREPIAHLLPDSDPIILNPSSSDVEVVSLVPPQAEDTENPGIATQL